MYGLDLSWSRSSVAFGLNYVIGLVGCSAAFWYIRYFAPASTIFTMLTGASVAGGYIFLWSTLTPFVDRIELGDPDPKLFTRGVVAFTYGVLTAFAAFLAIQSL